MDSTTPAPARLAPTLARYLLGLALLVFGLNMFFQFMPQPKTPPPAGAMVLIGALMKSGYFIPMFGVLFLLVGAMLVSNRFVPLALALFAPFILNSFLFHLCLEHTGLPMSVVFLALELYLAWSYRSAYRSMLAARVTPG